MPAPDDKSGIENVISQHGGTIADPASAPKELAARLDKLEVAIERAGQTADLTTNFNQYVIDLKNDVRAIRRTRFWLVVVTLLFLVALNMALWYMIFGRTTMFWLEDTSFKAAAFVSVVAASVVLLSIMLKGSFHALSDRTKDDAMPPHVREGIDVLKLAIGK